MKPSQGLSWLALDGQRHLQTVTMNLVLGCEPSLMLNHSVLTTDPLRWGVRGTAVPGSSGGKACTTTLF